MPRREKNNTTMKQNHKRKTIFALKCTKSEKQTIIFRKKWHLHLYIKKNSTTFAPQLSRKAIYIYGALTERLGSGLQNRPRQFESARHLRSSYSKGSCFFILYYWHPVDFGSPAKSGGG